MHVGITACRTLVRAVIVSGTVAAASGKSLPLITHCSCSLGPEEVGNPSQEVKMSKRQGGECTQSHKREYTQCSASVPCVHEGVHTQHSRE